MTDIEIFIMNCFKNQVCFAAWTPLAVVSALSTLTVTHAVAQDVAAQTLAPVVVTASRIEQLQTEALPHTTVITAEDIGNSQYKDLPSLLRREAGVQFTQNGGAGQSASLFLRGANPSESLVLIDGVPQRRQGFAAAPALEHILTDQIDRIEIVRGNVSAIYGSGAIGGVVQIFTKQGAGRPTVNFSSEVGSRGTQSITGGVSGSTDNTRYALAVSSFRTDGISANDLGQYPNEDPDKDEYRNKSVSGSVSNEWSKGHELGARIYANEGKFDFDGGGFGTPTDINFGRSKQQSLAVFSKNRFAPQWLSTVTLSRIEARNENTNISADGYKISDESTTSLLQWSNEINLFPNWTVVAGIDSAREDFDTSNINDFSSTRNDYDRSTSSLYAGLNGKMARHQFQINVRHDHVGGAGSDLTGFLGYGYAVNSALKLIANMSTAFNAPTLAQLHDAFSGNSELKSERAKSYEIGAQYALDETLVRATLFKTKTKDQFAIDPDNCFDGAFPLSCPTFNLDKSSNEGLEFSAKTRFTGLDAQGMLTLQNPKNERTGDRLIRRAKTLGSIILSKSIQSWRIGTEFQYTGDRPDRDFATQRDVKLDSFWLTNFNVRYEATQNLSLYGRIENVFDREYQTAYGFSQPERGIFVGLNWKM